MKIISEGYRVFVINQFYTFFFIIERVIIFNGLQNCGKLGAVNYLLDSDSEIISWQSLSEIKHRCNQLLIVQRSISKQLSRLNVIGLPPLC